MVDAWMRDHWRVVPDPDEYEFIRSPQYQLALFMENGFLSGDCDDSATLAASLFLANGWPCQLVAIRMHHDYEFSHVWARCVLGEGSFFDVDPIVPLYQMPVTGFAESMEVAV